MSDGIGYTQRGRTLLRRGNPECRGWVVGILLLYLVLRRIFGLWVSTVGVGWWTCLIPATEDAEKRELEKEDVGWKA